MQSGKVFNFIFEIEWESTVLDGIIVMLTCLLPGLPSCVGSDAAVLLHPVREPLAVYCMSLLHCQSWEDCTTDLDCKLLWFFC